MRVIQRILRGIHEVPTPKETAAPSAVLGELETTLVVVEAGRGQLANHARKLCSTEDMYS